MSAKLPRIGALCILALGVPCCRALEVHTGADTIEVDTGVLKLAIPRFAGPLLRQAWLDVNANGAYEDTEALLGERGLDCFVRLHNARKNLLLTYAASVAQEHQATLEVGSSQRATVRVSGWQEDGEGGKFAPYVVRLEVHARQSTVRVLHRLQYDGDPERDFLQAAGLDLSLRTELPWKVTLPELVPQPSRRGKTYVLQETTGRYVAVSAPVGEGRPLEQHGKRMAGWIDLATDRYGLAVALHNGGPQLPRELSADPTTGRILVGLIPPHGRMLLDLRSEPHNSTAEPRGVTFTHELRLDFHRGPRFRGSAPQPGGSRALADAGEPQVLFRQGLESRQAVELSGGRSQGGEFVPGKVGQGLKFVRGTTLTFSSQPGGPAGDLLSRPKLDLMRGTVELWHRPDYGFNDRRRHVFVAAGGPKDLDVLVFEKTATNELALYRSWGLRALYVTTYARARWAAGEWVHLAATWEGSATGMGAARIYVNGKPARPLSTEHGQMRLKTGRGCELGLPLPPVLIPPDLDIGHFKRDFFANGIIDELTIWDQPCPAFNIAPKR